MIEEPAKLIIKKPSRRPTKEQIQAFQGIPTEFVVDALGGAGALHPTAKKYGQFENAEHSTHQALFNLV